MCRLTARARSTRRRRRRRRWCLRSRAASRRCHQRWRRARRRTAVSRLLRLSQRSPSLLMTLAVPIWRRQHLQRSFLRANAARHRFKQRQRRPRVSPGSRRPPPRHPRQGTAQSRLRAQNPVRQASRPSPQPQPSQASLLSPPQRAPSVLFKVNMM